MGDHSEEYKARINSPEWRELRAQLIMVAGYKCDRCGEACSGLEVHHRHYRSLGAENPNDLEVLCPDCHEVADRERETETAERIWMARVTGWARKKYGDLEDLDFEMVEDEFQQWLDDQGECDG